MEIAIDQVKVPPASFGPLIATAGASMSTERNPHVAECCS